MRWIVTIDYWGNCLGMGEDHNGIPKHCTLEQGDDLPMEFRLYAADGVLLFEGKCGDIDADWWHGFEPLMATWGTFRCRRLSYRRVGTNNEWRWLQPR